MYVLRVTKKIFFADFSTFHVVQQKLESHVCANFLELDFLQKKKTKKARITVAGLLNNNNKEGRPAVGQDWFKGVQDSFSTLHVITN